MGINWLINVIRIRSIMVNMHCKKYNFISQFTLEFSTDVCILNNTLIKLIFILFSFDNDLN